MKRVIPILMVAGVALALSCSKSEIPFFDDNRYIYMDYPEEGNSKFPFSFIVTTEDSYRLAIPLTYAGRVLTQDLTYAVRAKGTGGDNLIQGTEYELPQLIFRKGQMKDTLFVTLHRTERMKSKVLTLNLELVSNENFLALQENQILAEISVSAMVSQPSWWNQSVIDNYLGDYSDLKYELFAQHGYSGDYGALDEDNKRRYALKFKAWLELNPTYENGVLITVPIYG